MREHDIRRAIKNLPGEHFERFAVELLRRELYPGLNPTSSSHDLGEDARTELSTVCMHDGQHISVSASKTANWTKIKEDCQRCQDTHRQIDVFVFATAGSPRTDLEEVWRGKVKEQFGWALECRTMSWLAQVASAPSHESLVDDYLHIPPPGGDFVQAIDREFAHHTDQALEQIKPVIPGMAEPLPRKEIARIEDQLCQGKAVLLTGEAGTGKSGIGKLLAQSARAQGKAVLYLDARHTGHVQSESQLRQHLSLKGPVHDGIRRIGGLKGCRVIVDQLDSAAGRPPASVLVRLALDCVGFPRVEVIVISRKSEGYEQQLLQDLVDSRFVELTCHPVSEITVTAALGKLGIPEDSSDVVLVGRNLLNLELIAKIKQALPDFDFSALTDEVELWEHYVEVLKLRERIGSSYDHAEQIMAQAVSLARSGLRSTDHTFILKPPLEPAHRRLVSWKMIVCDYGQSYRFHHEKLQDYLYAWDATQRSEMPAAVLGDLGVYRARGVLVWMDKIYSRRNRGLHIRFLKGILNVHE